MSTIRETLANFLTRGSYNALREEARASTQTALHFREAASRVSAQLLYQQGWQLLNGPAGCEWNSNMLSQARRLSRQMYLNNPIINRGVNVQTDYVFGQGITVHCEDTAANEVLQEFWDDVKNKAELTDIEALQDKEREQQLNGEHFFVFFPNKLTGRVRVRTFEPDEIEDVITNPEDSKEPWFYKRCWAAKRLDYSTGQTATEERTAYYPDWNYNPAKKQASIGGAPIQWDTPIYHVKTGGLRRMKRGISEIYCQLSWAEAYKDFLENRATVASALSRFTTKVKEISTKGVAAVSKQLGSTLGVTRPGVESNPPTAAGSTAVIGPGRELEAISVKGATIHPDEGRRFLLMVCAGSGLPETFYGDASVGTLATAQSLDRPTELMMLKRRQFWANVLSNIALYVLVRNINAPGGRLRGKVIYNDTTPVVKIGGKPVSIQVDFPELLEHDVKAQVESIDKAASRIPDRKLIARLMLKALKVEKIDELLKDMTFDEPQPEPQPGTQPGTQPSTQPEDKTLPKAA